MGKNLWLTEKPSQARDIAAGLSEKFEHKRHWLESESHIIVWAIGHLIELDEPQDYNAEYSEWSFALLPIIPSTFNYHVKPETKDQFNAIKRLIHREDVEQVIEAGDPAREGELILRLILYMTDCKKPVYRFWLTMAYTPEAVQKGFAEIKPVSEYEDLFVSAQVRQQADWLIGMNATRAFTIKMGRLCSLGRVQTPALSVIVKRELEIQQFKPQKYYTVNALFKCHNGEYKGILLKNTDTEENEDDAVLSAIATMDEALAILDIIHNSDGRIIGISKTDKSEKPPLLFSLTELQKDANKLYGFTAEGTLNIVQKLYEEHKAVTYPRTESKYLASNQPQEVEKILKKLTNIKFSLEKCAVAPNNKRIFDDSKLTDHHALIPTGVEPHRLNDNESKIFNLICERFIAAFYPDYQYQTTTVLTDVKGNMFKSTGRTIKDMGWREIYGGQTKDILLPAQLSDDVVQVKETKCKEQETRPPARYTESGILEAMENAAKFVSDENLKKVLRETSGLGTAATRANIIETLKKREFVKVDNKHLIPTALGMKLIGIIKDERIADPAYTAFMEQELEDIAYHGKNPDSFLHEVKSYTKTLVRWAEQLDIAPIKESKFEVVGKCPVCGKHVYEYSKTFSCVDSRNSCSFVLFKNKLAYFGKSITTALAKQFLNGKPVKLKGLKAKGGSFNAEGVLFKDEKYGWGIKLEFPKKRI